MLNAAGEQSGLWRWSTSGGGWNVATGFGYDNVHRLTTLAIDVSGTSYDSTATLTYNPASQIMSEARTNDSYRWDGQVNVSRPYASNGLNQYSAVNGTSFTYDPDGNLTSDGTNSYVYDMENRLVFATISGAGINLFYDPLGRLYQTSATNGSTTRFLYDGDDLVAEYDTSGNLLRRYGHGPKAGDDPQVWFEGSSVADSARRYLYADERGSIVALTNNDGVLTYINSYDEYGIPADVQALTTKGRFRYTGQAWLPELGMYYYKARMYSPTLGRFMQIDPIGCGDGMNMYLYAGDDPVNGSDLSGLARTRWQGGVHYTWACVGGETGPMSCNWTRDGLELGMFFGSSILRDPGQFRCRRGAVCQRNSSPLPKRQRGAPSPQSPCSAGSHSGTGADGKPTCVKDTEQPDELSCSSTTAYGAVYESCHYKDPAKDLEYQCQVARNARDFPFTLAGVPAVAAGRAANAAAERTGAGPVAKALGSVASFVGDALLLVNAFGYVEAAFCPGGNSK